MGLVFYLYMAHKNHFNSCLRVYMAVDHFSMDKCYGQEVKKIQRPIETTRRI